MNDNLRRVLTTLVIIACIVGLVLAAQHTQRGDDEEPTYSGGVVELQAPTPESSVLSQAQLVIDLTTRYDARFVVNGVAIPDAEVQRRPELNQITFVPGPGKAIEKFPAGRNCVQADIFRIDNVRENVAPARWCFNVT